MSDDLLGGEGFDRIHPIDLNEEMETSYIDYAMSVIVGRALPEVRDGLKPVHRRILYAMYDSGYRPERGYVKSARPVSDTMGQFHPHGDSAIYDTLVRLAQDWNMRYPLVDGQGNFGSRGNDGPAAMRYTECRLTPLAMEMVRDIRENTVDFSPNYDGKTQEPDVLPSRVPNLLMNGSNGIAVGMATNIPPHNLNELADAIFWLLENPDADEAAALEACMSYVKGPDFPTSGQIVGSQGINDAYTTGRGSIRMRGVTSIEEEGSRQIIVITELPYQVNPDNMISNIAEQVRDGKLAGISKIEDESSDRVGMRIVVTLKRDAVPRVVLNNLYKHSQLQTNFGANMLSIVDGVPRTLRLDQMLRYYVTHQIEVIVRRTQHRLEEAEKRAHILRGLVKALDMLDEVIALIRRSATVDVARSGLIDLLTIDEIQADAILAMQLRRLAALERQKIIDELAEIEIEIADYKDILAKPERQRAIVRDELKEIVTKYGDERRTQIIAATGDVTEEDLIARENVVVTITSTGYAKRTKVDAYKSQRRGGKGVRGAELKQDDVVRHFFVCSTHDWILFFTNFGRVYRLKAYELPEASRTARGQHVANLLEFQPEERIAQVIQLQSYEDAPYLVLATAQGRVKKSRLSDYESNRSGGLIAINLGEEDKLIGAALCSNDDELLLVSEEGQSIRFSADDDQLRPMGRATAGVKGMRFRGDDQLLAMTVVRSDAYLLVATSGGYGKRTSLEEYSQQGRGGLGVVTFKYTPKRGKLIAAVVVDEDDQIFAITSAGGVIRTEVNQIRPSSRATMGVRLVNLEDGVELLAIDRNVEGEGEETAEAVATGAIDGPADRGRQTEVNIEPEGADQ
ncbi:DNA gyrase subunit A [Corynebacterium pseudotuberculosis]|uniref:DNA gyrase subunit A n=2 Tax=Corynebacterium pseudotuberculosis TaxID=1719 RepID=D9QD64_CORP2|nr:DNA gyrase subunit A [Corynebacterium pseudotuberculosis]AER68139.1 DNA gyrase subunit A [Corynebacterium pseudotuberculosis 1/06-A]ADK27802.1 DNA gyrase subunit A [Corynebacterium pseudotuberculosis FRC41]ADL09508.1 DNA gyrase subunit A [Corynebacterium pseudotuberculosis C231]ADL19919.1 DNA gyrase subunit A [Corynebacterium pseudotuberculosis 1002]ADO25307.3 DNA gyrase subunit A [Corynebacterium pseudotuberculosis I19]